MPLIDPKLKRQIDRLRAQNRSLQALVTLERGSMKGKAPSEVDAVVNSLVRDAAEESHFEPGRVVIFSNINSFAIEAPAQFLDNLLKRQQIGSATLNEA